MIVFAAAIFAVCVGLNCAQNGSLNCTYTGVTEVLRVKEGSQNGSPILKITDNTDAELVRFNSPEPPPFIALDNGTLYYNATLDIDNNQAWCANIYNWGLFVKCSGEPRPNKYSIRVNLTDDFPPEFLTSTYSTDIEELSPSGTSVYKFDRSALMDRDCESVINIGGNTQIIIEDGDPGGTFRIDKAGRIYLNKPLDYEYGSAEYFLNISVSDVSYPNRKSYTTLNVKVIDLDDNDPVFNDTSYEVHVAEDDAASVGVWRQTDPPLAVYDPDQHAPEDPLIISLYDAADSNILEVNSTSGEVRLMKTFDHEQEASVAVVLKVQQTYSSWRSSTVTLTIFVDDVNDNRPEFLPSTYNVNVAEHSAVGTSVAFVSATDADSGDNAVFNYTLASGGQMFAVATQLLGEKRYGFLYVRDSSLIDREKHPGPITVTIDTQELTSSVGGGGCTGIHCQATVTIQLLDINDHSPVFQRDSYDVIVDHIPTKEVLITQERDVKETYAFVNELKLRIRGINDEEEKIHVLVNATDKDEGENAILKYSLQSYGLKGCSGVVIDSNSGDVSFTVNATQTEDCSVMVTACDSPLDVTYQRCTSVPVQIAVHLANETVILDAPVAPALLIADRTVVQSELSTILGVIVTVRNIVSDSTGTGSRIIISAKNSTSPSSGSLPRAELQQLVDKRISEIKEFFGRYQQTPSPENETVKSSMFTVEFISLIAVSGVLLVALVVAFVFIYRSRKSNRRQQRLIQRLSGVNDIYDKAGDVNKVENGTASLISNIALPDDDESAGVVNPVYREDEETAREEGEDSPRSSSSSEDSTVNGGVGETTAGSSSPEGTTTGNHHHHDADSGVPSDRENGVDSGSETVTPVMSRSSGVAGEGSSYLDAVLNEETSLSRSSGGVSSDDTSGYANVVQDPPLHTDNVHVSGDNDIAAVAVFGEPKQASPEEEQERIVIFTDDGINSGEPSLLERLSPSAGTGLATNPHHHDAVLQSSAAPEEPGRAVTDEDDDDEEEVIGVMSKLGQLARPSTPPLRQSGGSAEDDEKFEIDGDVPEEPEPDYAKKVRFNVQVTDVDTHAVEKEDHGNGEDGGSALNPQGHDGEVKGGTSNGQRREGPEDADSNTDSVASAHSHTESTSVEADSNFDFNAEEEITAF